MYIPTPLVTWVLAFRQSISRQIIKQARTRIRNP